jgi:hypothetical protein
MKSVIIVMTLLGAICGAAESNSSLKNKKSEGIKAYCIDFNWGIGRKAGFAKPGTWKDADPKEHVKWYKDVGANVIQTFAVSCNGYAWYKSKLIPEQPGLKNDFLTEMVKLGHAEGMKVMGYFCIGANTRWGKENPLLSYGTPSSCHIPYTDEYLAYLSLAITDAIKTTGIDGFMIDWVWMPNRKATNGKWIDAEKKLYKQLMGEEFPGEDKLTKEKNIAYGQKAIGRCWKAIHKATKEVDPNCLIWLTTNSLKSSLVKNSDMYKEVDWLMGEAGKLKEIERVRPLVGKNTQLLTCLSDFGGGDAAKDVPEAIKAGIGLYGYAKPANKGGTIDLEKIFPKQITQLRGNEKRISVLARAYRGKSVDSVWKDTNFFEPETAVPFRLKLRKRSSRHKSDAGKVVFGDVVATIVLDSPYQCGRAMLTRVGSTWPSSIVVRVPRQKSKKPKPYPSEFRIANERVGVSITKKDNITVVAGKMEKKLGMGLLWREKFLNEGKPNFPIKVGSVKAILTDDVVEFVVPLVITESNPSVIYFEWGNNGRVF